MKRLLLPLTPILFLLLFSAPLVMADMQCPTPFEDSKAASKEIVTADDFSISVTPQADNQCCVAGTDTITGESFCFCVCPGDIENTPNGTLVCQSSGLTYWESTTGVVGKIVSECPAGNFPNPTETTISVLELFLK